MRKRVSFLILCLALPLSLLTACVSLKGGLELPARHPAEAELPPGPPSCTDCHEARSEELAFERYNHTPYFMDNHRQQAYQSEQLCSICHQSSFCNNCHAVRVELKPSIRNQTDNDRRMPHRGDYLSRHRIDGRIDPTSCFRCHGNPKTSRTCVACHG